MRTSQNIQRENVVDLSNEFLMSGITSTPLTTLIYSDTSRIKKARDVFVKRTIKKLSTEASGGRKEGADPKDLELSSFYTIENNLEIFSKATAVSRTAAQISGGIDEALGREMADRLLEIKLDMEKAFISGVLQEETGLKGRAMAGLGELAKESDSDNIIDLLTKPLTDKVVGDATQILFENGTSGGDLYLVCNGSVKRQISQLYKDSPNVKVNIKPGDTKVGVTVQEIITDFGTLNVVVSNHIASDKVVIFNMNYVEVEELNSPQYELLSKTGDSTKGMIVAENTIITHPDSVVVIENIKV